jgi:hypothetical protein
MGVDGSVGGETYRQPEGGWVNSLRATPYMDIRKHMRLHARTHVFALGITVEV